MEQSLSKLIMGFSYPWGGLRAELGIYLPRWSLSVYRQPPLEVWSLRKMGRGRRRLGRPRQKLQGGIPVSVRGVIWGRLSLIP